MVLRPGLDTAPGFDVAGYFDALFATLDRGTCGAAPGASRRSHARAAPAERARSFMQQWLERTAARTPWGTTPTALCREEAEEAFEQVEALGPDPVGAVRRLAPNALESRAAQLGLTVPDLVQLVTTDLLARSSGGTAPAV